MSALYLITLAIAALIIVAVGFFAYKAGKETGIEVGMCTPNPAAQQEYDRIVAETTAKQQMLRALLARFDELEPVSVMAETIQRQRHEVNRLTAAIGRAQKKYEDLTKAIAENRLTYAGAPLGSLEREFDVLHNQQLEVAAGIADLELSRTRAEARLLELSQDLAAKRAELAAQRTKSQATATSDADSTEPADQPQS